MKIPFEGISIVNPA